VGVEESGHARLALAAKRLFERTPQWTAQPQTDWDTKPLLPAGEGSALGAGHEGRACECAGLPPGQLELGRDTACSSTRPDRGTAPGLRGRTPCWPVHRHQVLAGEIELTVLDRSGDRTEPISPGTPPQLPRRAKVATGIRRPSEKRVDALRKPDPRAEAGCGLWRKWEARKNCFRRNSTLPYRDEAR